MLKNGFVFHEDIAIVICHVTLIFMYCIV